METKRWKERLEIFKFVYMVNIQNLNDDEILKVAFEDYIFDELQMQIINSYVKHHNEYKELLSKNLKIGWQWSRISYIDQAILYTALSEKDAINSPKAVIINEAIKNAKHYSEEKDNYIYINAILDKVIK